MLSLFTLMIIVNLKQTVSLMWYQPLRNLHIPAIVAQSSHIPYGNVNPSRLSRRRARPAWSTSRTPRRQWWGESDRELTNSHSTTTAMFAGGFLDRGRCYPNDQEEQEHQTPGWSPSNGVVIPSALTHKQLPDETLYILDGTSMLFRAFYRRGSSGWVHVKPS